MLAACLLWSACASTDLIRKESVDVAIEHILQSIDQAIDLAHAQHAASGMDLEVTKVSVLLQTAISKDAGQDVTVSVLEIEAGESEEFTQAVTLTLEPPKTSDGTESTPAEPAHPRLVRDLHKGIDAAFLAARGAHTGLLRLHPDGIPLEAKTIQVAISFTVTTSGEGLPTISILGVNLTATRSKVRVHTVTMSFEPSSDQ